MIPIFRCSWHLAASKGYTQGEQAEQLRQAQKEEQWMNEWLSALMSPPILKSVNILKSSDVSS